MEFFQKYFTIKNENEERENNEKNNKLRSIIFSLYICYYIRLTNDIIRANFDFELRCTLLKLINNDDNIDEIGSNLIKQIKNQDLKKEISNRPKKKINNFSDFLRNEQDYLIDQIELDKAFGKNGL